MQSVLLFYVSYKGVDQHSIYTYYEHILSVQLFSNMLSELCKPYHYETHGISCYVYISN